MCDVCRREVFDWANIITQREIKTVNESLPHCVSPVYSSLSHTSSPTHTPFFTNRIITNSNLLYFITTTPLAVQPPTTWNTHTQPLNTICMKIRPSPGNTYVTTLARQRINLITGWQNGGRGGWWEGLRIPTCHHPGSHQRKCDCFVITRQAFIKKKKKKKAFYNHKAACSTVSVVERNCVSITCRIVQDLNIGIKKIFGNG